MSGAFIKTVKAVQFDRAKLGDYSHASFQGVYQQECYCHAVAQDGERCPNHGETMRYELRDYRRGHKPVRHGDWIVDDPEHGQIVVPKEQFARFYKPLPTKEGDKK